MTLAARFVLVSLACCLTGQLRAQSVDPAETQVRTVMEELKRASLAGDSKAVASLMADEYVQTDISGHVQTKATWFEEYFNPLAELIKSGKFHWSKYDRRDLQFRIYGDTAVVMGSLDLYGAGAKWSPVQHTWIADPNSSFNGTLRFTHIYIRRNGKWLLAALHNAIPISPPTASGSQDEKK